MSPIDVVDVPDPGQWTSTLAGSADDACELLTAIDHGAELEILVVLRGREGLRMLRTRVPAKDPCLDSAVAVLPAVAWHEREVAEMFGVTFAGHPDPRPLLLREHVEAPPLRRSTPLPERIARPWPGARDAGARRRPTPPPGVRNSWQGRDVDEGAP